MASNDFFIDLNSKMIKLPSNRWYQTPDGTYPSVTTILGVHSKPGLNTWQLKLAQQGVDTKSTSREAMDEGSKVHNACERLMKGEELTFINENGDDNFKFFEEWLPICRFKEAYNELEIEPILIEQTIWSAKYEYAGTLDLLCKIKPDKKSKEKVTAVIDLKRSANAFTDYHWQVASYYQAVNEMINSDKEHLENFKSLLKNKEIEKIDKAYLLLLNTDTKKGWRLTEVDNLEEKFNLFQSCNVIWKGENPNYDTSEKMYPLTLNLKGGDKINE